MEPSRPAIKQNQCRDTTHELHAAKTCGALQLGGECLGCCQADSFTCEEAKKQNQCWEAKCRWVDLSHRSRCTLTRSSGQAAKPHNVAYMASGSGPEREPTPKGSIVFL